MKKKGGKEKARNARKNQNRNLSFIKKPNEFKTMEHPIPAYLANLLASTFCSSMQSNQRKPPYVPDFWLLILHW